MANLLEETLKVLGANGKSEEDILWVGERVKSADGSWTLEQPTCFCDWGQAKFLFDRDYDDSFGIQYVNEDLVVVGKDFWLERHEYDGFEWWEIKTMPTKPKENRVPDVFAERW